MIGKSDEEMWDKYVEEYAKENEQMENEQREIAEAADAYMNGFIEDVHSDEELVELLEGLEDGTMVHIIVEQLPDPHKKKENASAYLLRGIVTVF